MPVPSFLRNLLKRNSSSKDVSNDEGGVVTRGVSSAMAVVQEPMLFGLAEADKGFYRLLFDSDELNAQPSVPHKLLQDVVLDTLSQKETRLKAVPRLPSVIPRLMQSLRDPNSSAKNYVNIINKDPVMSAAVLKLANSVYFNPINARIANIELAVVKLGIIGLRTVLSAAVMQPIIQRQSPYFSQLGHKLWQHSLCCAVACELMARQRGLVPFKAYIMGLTHDIGKITIFSELCKQLKLNGDKGGPGYQAFAPLMRSFSTRLSHWVVSDWELPEEICTGLGEQLSLAPGKQVSPYGQLLFQANLACEFYAAGRHNNEELTHHLIEELSLPADIFVILEQLSAEVGK